MAHATIATLPTFWPTRPELWFLQAEAVFEDRVPPITTDKAKCKLVLRALTCEALEQVEHVLTGPEPVGGRYQALHTALIDCYGRTQASKHAQLIDLVRQGALGDRKPMQFLLHMRSLAGGDPEAWERAIFLNAMPPEVRTVLANSNAPNTKRLAVEAGHILEQHMLSKRNRPGTYSVQAPPAPEVAPALPVLDDHAPLPQHYPPPLPGAQASVNAVSGARDRRPPRRNTGQRQGQGARTEFKLCFAHARYGTQAFSCQGGSCPMQGVPLAPHPQAQGNGRAGR